MSEPFLYLRILPRKN